jgi:site-specific DNA-methyltransferase (adenine-specific)
MSVELHHGRLQDILPTLAESTFDACVTDAPYELGFMGKHWDRSGVAFQPETWAAILRVLKPGAHLVSFGGTRTYHRMVCAIEDAGFEIRDQIGWAFGSGFPKSSNQDGQWTGWGTALKPAWEPICLARKPLIGTVAENLAAHGVGAINIDGCRITVGDGDVRSGGFGEGKRPWQTGGNGNTVRLGSEVGRWPANLCHDGSPQVVALFPSEAGAAAPVTTRNGDKFRSTYGAFAGNVDEQGSTFHADSGSAARFFYCPKASRADRDAGCEALDKRPLLWSSGTQNPGSFQAPRTDRSARNPHPTVKPTELMRWLCRLIIPPHGTILDPMMGSGSTGRAAVLEGFNFVGIEMTDEYLPIARARIADAERLRADEEAERKAAGMQSELELGA